MAGFERISATEAGPAPVVTGGLSGFERVVLALGASVLAYQLFLPPIVGMADSGSFPRVMGAFGIGYYPQSGTPCEYDFVVQRLTVRSANVWHSGFVTSQSILVSLSLGLQQILSKDGYYDIRYVGAVCGAFLLGLLAGFLVWTRRLRPIERWCVVFAAMLLFTDVGYVAYFNSFYSEPASLLFLLSTILVALALSRCPKRPRLLLLLYCASAVLFALAKPQNTISGLVMAGYTFALTPISDRAGWKGACATACGVIALLSAVSYLLVPDHIRGPVAHTAVFHEILGYSDSVADDLDELGLDRSLSRYSGTNPYGAKIEKDPDYHAAFLAKFTTAKLLRFYLSHPGRFEGVLDRTAREAITERPHIGNFAESAGLAAGAQSQAFDLGSRIHAAVGPSSLLGLVSFFGLYSGVVLLIRVRSKSISTRVVCDLLIVVVMVGATQYLTVAIMQGSIEPTRHLLLLKVTFDIACLVLVYGAATLASRWGGRLRGARRG